MCGASTCIDVRLRDGPGFDDTTQLDRPASCRRQLHNFGTLQGCSQGAAQAIVGVTVACEPCSYYLLYHFVGFLMIANHRAVYNTRGFAIRGANFFAKFKHALLTKRIHNNATAPTFFSPFLYCMVSRYSESKNFQRLTRTFVSVG